MEIGRRKFMVLKPFDPSHVARTSSRKFRFPWMKIGVTIALEAQVQYKEKKCHASHEERWELDEKPCDLVA